MLKGQFFTKNIPIMRKDVRIEAKYCVFEPIDVGSAAPEAVLRTLEALVASVEASTERAQLASSEDAAAPILQPPAASSDTDAVPAAAADPAAAPNAARTAAPNAAPIDLAVGDAAAASTAAPAHGSAEQAAQECLPSPPLRTTARAARAARAAAGSGGSAVRSPLYQPQRALLLSPTFRAMVSGISGR
jgi:hypothetical protein